MTTDRKLPGRREDPEVDFSKFAKILEGFIGKKIRFCDIYDNSATLSGITERDGQIILNVTSWRRKPRFSRSQMELTFISGTLELCPSAIVRITMTHTNQYYVAFRDTGFIELG